NLRGELGITSQAGVAPADELVVLDDVVAPVHNGELLSGGRTAHPIGLLPLPPSLQASLPRNRQVLECASPLELSDEVAASKAPEGLAQGSVRTAGLRTPLCNLGE